MLRCCSCSIKRVSDGARATTLNLDRRRHRVRWTAAQSDLLAARCRSYFATSRNEEGAEGRPIAGVRRAKVKHVSEAVGESDSHRHYRSFGIGPDGQFIPDGSSAKPQLSLKERAMEFAEDAVAFILPRGYPESVHPLYSSYARWQFVAMAGSAAAGVMSTQALLYAMGLGAGAAPLAATLNWVMKDGLGQLGGVLFSSLVNTRLDANPKLWRMVAAVSLDVSVALELMAPLAPAYFLPIASVANIGKNVSFLAASASKAAIHNVLAARENLADVTAKSGAQTILSCMLGTGAGILVSSQLGSKWALIAPAALCFSAVHLTANYLSLRKLGLPTIDRQRLQLITRAHREQGLVPSPDSVAGKSGARAVSGAVAVGVLQLPAEAQH